MNRLLAFLLSLMLVPVAARTQAPPEFGTEEFGMTAEQLVRAVEKVESLIAQCMRKQGFRYVAVDYLTVRKGMTADKSMPGLDEEEFIDRFGYGISTLYTGQAPQLSTGYSPAREGLGEANIAIYKGLSEAERVAYTRALCGDDPNATFAVGLEGEDFSRCGGCTRQAIEQVFDEDQLKASYYNPVDAMINQDPRMKKALRKYAEAMREAGFDYDHPDEVESDIRNRLDVITDNGSIPLAELSEERRASLAKLQDYERRVALLDYELAVELFDPVEEKIQKELFARDVK
jgi:hypothetical protein